MSISQTTSNKVGRPRKIDIRSTRTLLRCLNSWGENRQNLTVKSLVVESGLEPNLASRRTFSRILNENGFGYYQRRKKGLLTEKDRKNRTKFARNAKVFQTRNSHFWEDEVAFYLDGVSFVHKFNPMGSSPGKCKVWRKKGEGLMFTGRGSNELAGGRRCILLLLFLMEKASFYVNRTTK